MNRQKRFRENFCFGGDNRRMKPLDSKSQSRFSTPAVTQLRREQDDVMLEGRVAYNNGKACAGYMYLAKKNLTLKYKKNDNIISQCTFSLILT